MIRVRAENNAIMLWNKAKASTAFISGEEMETLDVWAKNGHETGFISRLRRLGFIDETVKADIADSIGESATKQAPLHSFCAPESLHIELTSRCALHCKQCYKGSANDNDISHSKLQQFITEAEAMKVFQIALGGGEPLLYPHLADVVSDISRRGMSVSVTTGGVGLDAVTLNVLGKAGLNHIQVSLNGADEQTNTLSRDGYSQALASLRLLSGHGMSFGINWVARMDNIDNLPEIISLTKTLNAGNINILRYKPSPNEEYDKIKLTDEKYRLLISIIKQTKGIAIKTDSAFSNLLCDINSRGSKFGGCGAGRRFMAINSRGNCSPCSHTRLSSPAVSLYDYWYKSPELQMFRETERCISEPCSSCAYLSSCRGCRVVCNNFYDGEKDCPFAKPVFMTQN